MRFWRLLKRPDLIGFYAKERTNQVATLLRRRRPVSLALYALAGVFGPRVYDRACSWLAARSGESLVERPVGDHRMILDLDDPGISRLLLLYGVHEERPTTAFTRELERVRQTVSDPLVVDVGGNIGYYALVEAAAIGEKGTVFATEPVPATRRLLERNIALNGYTDRVTIDGYAVGRESGSRAFHVGAASNRNRFIRDDASDRETEDAVDVEVMRLDDYVAAKGVTPDSVNAIRMDVEGFELDVFRGMEDVLAASGPLVVYLEVHPGILTTDELRELVALLRERDFEIAAIESDIVSDRPFRTAPKAENFDDLLEIDRPYALIVRK